jgi:hypothetical protein
MGDIKYYWCPNHGFWTAHKPEDCTLAINAPGEATKPPVKAPAKRSLTFAEASAALAGHDGDDGESVDQE